MTGRGGLGMRGGILFSSTTPPVPFGLPFPGTLEAGVGAVPGVEERDPGEAAVPSGSRKDAIEDSRRREGILDWDFDPGVFCRESAHVEQRMEVQSLLTVPARARGVAGGDISNDRTAGHPLINVPDTFCFLFFVGEDNGEPGCDTIHESILMGSIKNAQRTRFRFDKASSSLMTPAALPAA